MNIKTSELTGAALDWAVAKCEGWDAPIFKNSTRAYVATNEMGLYTFSPSTDWAQGGMIIERELIETAMRADQWQATMHLDNGSIYEQGTTPLIAAMRCYVASKLGDTVDIPDELTGEAA